jgi:membrane protease YdiL (CAAX protease family)
MSNTAPWIQRTLRLDTYSLTRIRWVFIGSQGIRAGWSALIFVSIFIAQMIFSRRLILGHAPMPRGPVPPYLAFLFESYQLAAALIATAIMAWIERRALWSYGLAGRGPAKLFLAGWLSGLFCLSALIGVLHAQGFLVIEGLALHGSAILHYALLWLLIFTMVGVGEEIVNRGYLLSTLARWIGFWPAAVLTSIAFGAGHLMNYGESAAGIAQVVAAGLAWCVLLRVTGSLWAGIGFHAAWDWAQSYLYGTGDSGWMMQGHLLATHAAGDPRLSGGTVGPEGSLLAAPLVIAGPLALALALRAARHVRPRLISG